jgi:putative phosphoribosyl transferase
VFRDRSHAGQVLAQRLRHLEGKDVMVLGLPRGGVPVAAEVARVLSAPLDVFVVRKLGVPGHEELAMGALGRGGIRIVNAPVVHTLGISDRVLDAVAEREQRELERREEAYRGRRPYPELRGRTVIVVDDGLATGSSMRAAAKALRQHEPARLVAAAPVAAASTCVDLEDEVDEVVCVVTPEPMVAVGQWYRDFTQTTDDEVRRLLAEAGQETRGATPPRRRSPRTGMGRSR